MRISDWSSDVCSSDLGLVWRSAQSIVTPYVIEVDQSGQVRTVGEAATPYRPADAQIAHHLARFVTLVRSLSIDPIVVRQNWLDAYDYTTDKRSEEHTSELQSLMRISYAVFCLKKKHNKHVQHSDIHMNTPQHPLLKNDYTSNQ